MRLERLIRRVMQRTWRWQRALTLGVRGIVIDGEDRVLLVRQTYTRGWLLPGGGVEFSETIETSLGRELEEEAGVEVTGPLELLGIYSNREIFPGDHVAIYIVRNWRQARTVVANSEIAEVGFFMLDALPESTTPGTRRRIEEMLGRRPRQELW